MAEWPIASACQNRKSHGVKIAGVTGELRSRDTKQSGEVGFSKVKDGFSPLVIKQQPSEFWFASDWGVHERGKTKAHLTAISCEPQAERDSF